MASLLANLAKVRPNEDEPLLAPTVGGLWGPILQGSWLFGQIRLPDLLPCQLLPGTATDKEVPRY